MILALKKVKVGLYSLTLSRSLGDQSCFSLSSLSDAFFLAQLSLCTTSLQAFFTQIISSVPKQNSLKNCFLHCLILQRKFSDAESALMWTATSSVHLCWLFSHHKSVCSSSVSANACMLQMPVCVCDVMHVVFKWVQAQNERVSKSYTSSWLNVSQIKKSWLKVDICFVVWDQDNDKVFVSCEHHPFWCKNSITS